MKRIVEVDILMVGRGENVIIFPSGFLGVKMAIAVAEDAAYHISAWYPDEQQIEQMKNLDERTREEMKQSEEEEQRKERDKVIEEKENNINGKL